MPVLKEKIQLKKYPVVLHNRTVSPKTIRASFRKNKNRYRSASLTTEAALVFPLFFFTVYLLWQLFLLLLFQMRVCNEITGTAMKYAHLGYPERRMEERDVDISWLYQPILWNALPESDRVERLWIFCIPKEDGTIQVSVSYEFVCEAVFFTRLSLPIQQNFRFYPYLGETDEDVFAETETEATDTVYVTEFGTVYHESRACSYLNVVIRSVALADIETVRNSSGRRYSLCERCDNREAGETAYISTGGTKYHLVASCPALKRTVTEKNRDEVEDMPACHKCGNTEESREE